MEDSKRDITQFCSARFLYRFSNGLAIIVQKKFIELRGVDEQDRSHMMKPGLLVEQPAALPISERALGKIAITREVRQPDQILGHDVPESINFDSNSLRLIRQFSPRR
jgi:hypothetical protein